MKVTDELINKLAELSKLKFDKKEKEKIKKDFEKILEFVSKLDELDTEGIEPLKFPVEEEALLREDKVVIDISQQEALKNAPSKDTDYIKVHKVLNK